MQQHEYDVLCTQDRITLDTGTRSDVYLNDISASFCPALGCSLLFIYWGVNSSAMLLYV